jgi:hypothetical protein
MCAESTFEVDELYKGQLGVFGSTNVVDLGIYGRFQHDGEIGFGLTQLGRCHAEDHRTQYCSQHHGDEHADGRLPGQFGRCAESQTYDQQRYGESHPR